jgi:hypothetical protein
MARQAKADHSDVVRSEAMSYPGAEHECEGLWTNG